MLRGSSLSRWHSFLVAYTFFICSCPNIDLTLCQTVSFGCCSMFCDNMISSDPIPVQCYTLSIDWWWSLWWSRLMLLVTTIGTGKLKTISDIRVLGYSPSGDYIGMPALSQFTSTDTYYSTLFHEPTHWTGTHSRCNREMGKRFGDKQYAIEELVAELGAIFHCPIPRSDSTS